MFLVIAPIVFSMSLEAVIYLTTYSRPSWSRVFLIQSSSWLIYPAFIGWTSTVCRWSFCSFGFDTGWSVTPNHYISLRVCFTLAMTVICQLPVSSSPSSSIMLFEQLTTHTLNFQYTSLSTPVLLPHIPPSSYPPTVLSLYSLLITIFVLKSI